MSNAPQILGLKRSFGFGDRLGLATPGHIDALRSVGGFAPIFAQQSIREMERTGREPEAVMDTADEAIEAEGWTEPWGADADHLQTHEDVDRTARAGFCMFTIDPSKHVNNAAGYLSGAELETACDEAAAEGGIGREEASDLYLGKRWALDSGELRFGDATELYRAVAKYGAALAFTRRMAHAVEHAVAGRPHELEMSVDETDTPTSPAEHLFCALELQRLGVKVVSLAPRFVGDFEKGIDYKGDLSLFEEHYALHAEIARRFGPYKLSIHSGSDKFSVYPIMGRLSGELLHVKTAGTSYLEALRVVCRTDKTFFREIVAFCRDRYETDRATYHVSAALDDVPEQPSDDELEAAYLEHPSGREILHVTYGSVLQLGERATSESYRHLLMENLREHADLYREVLCTHLGKHLRLLAGDA